MQKTADENLQMSILAQASVFEEAFSIDWIQEMTGERASMILSALEFGLINQWLTRMEDGYFVFSDRQKLAEFHKMVQPDERQLLHRRALDILSSELPDDFKKNRRMVRHFLNFENDLNGCRLLLEEGNRHRHEFNSREALSYYNKALKDLRRIRGADADMLFIETTLQLAKVSVSTSDIKDVPTLIREAIRKANVLGDTPHLALLRMHLAHQEWFRSHYQLALKEFDLAWDMAKEIREPSIQRSARLFNMFFQFWRGNIKDAVSSYEIYAPEIEEAPDSRFLCLAKIIAGLCLGLVGQVAQGIGMLDAAHRHCLTVGDRSIASNASLNIGLLFMNIDHFAEATHYFNESMDEASSGQNQFVKVSALLCLAYTHYRQGKNEKSKKFLQEYLELSREIRMLTIQEPILLELCWAMRQGRYPEVETLSLEGEIRRTKKNQSIYMKGMTEYYQALSQQMKKQPLQNTVKLLSRAFKRVQNSGHCIGSATVGLELARVQQQSGHEDKTIKTAAPLVKDLHAIHASLVPDDFRFLVRSLKDDDKLLKEILNLGQDLVNLRDSHEIIGQIISTVNRITGAERGAIFLSDEKTGELVLKAAKNLTREDIHDSGFGDSMTVIKETACSEQGRIVEPDSELPGGKHIRSLICVPMRLNCRLIGILYHDNRLFKSIFRQSDLTVLGYFAALAAIALDNARIYQELEGMYQKKVEKEQYYEEQYLENLNNNEILGKSAAIKRVFSNIESVAKTDTTVLITGETGVGKELVARALHQNSSRSNGPFIRVNCAALSESLITGELFGHEKGAFTGATQKRIGRFELADTGSLFLDEIGDITPSTQVRLLRVLQNNEFERVGGEETIRSDFRLLVATNKDLKKEVRAGRFRKDLFYRLNVFPIHIPLLRDRKEDIPLLAWHFLRISAKKMNKTVTKITEEALTKLMSYSWPGNVRELENIVQRGVILSSGTELYIHQAEFHSLDSGEELLDLTLEENERNHIMRMLEHTGGKINGPNGAAEKLSIHPNTLRFRIKKLGISLNRLPGRV